MDLITDRKKVIIRPYTSYSSKTNPSSNETSDTHYFNIKTDGYESDKNSFANISLSGTDTAYIVFPNISALLDAKELVYTSQNQTLIMKFLLSQCGVLTLYLVLYIIPNFHIIDRDGSIIPILDNRSSNITHIKSFSLYMEIDNSTSIDQIKEKHQSVYRDDRLYRVFSTIKTSKGVYQIDSKERDVIYIDKGIHITFLVEEELMCILRIISGQ